MLAHRRLAAALSLALVMTLPGCKKEIYHGLTEKEANEILVVLKQANIDADKEPDTASGKKGLAFKIVVDEAAAIAAMRVMGDYQLPREQQPGMGDIFKTKSMIPTATEEKAQFLQALQGDLANSLEELDGIVDARVHVVLPEANPLGGDRIPAAASVLLKYRERARKEGEAATKAKEAEYRDLVRGMNEDLKRLRLIWTKELPALSTEDQRHLVVLDTYLTEKRGEDAEAKEARIALQKLKETATKRLGFQNVLAALPTFKDLDGLINKSDAVELESVGFPSATVRSFIARAIPRLLEDDVAVKFHKVIPMPEPKKYEIVGKMGGIDRNYFIAAAGAAAVLALALIGMAMWVMSLKKAVAMAEARAKQAAATTAPPPGA